MHVRLSGALPRLALVIGLLAISACSAVAPEATAGSTGAKVENAAIQNHGGVRAPGAAQAASGAGSFVQAVTATPFNMVSLPALMEQTYDGRDLRVGRVLQRTVAYTRYFVTYRSGDLTISGTLNVPNRSGRFPVLVLAHGYIAPEDYEAGAGLRREQAYLASSGYVVLHTDYRNHAQSDDDRYGDVPRPLGYPEDLVNAVRAIKNADLPYVDTDQVGLFGRSMGGGVTLNALVAQPGLVDAAILYSPVSSRAVDNFDRWVRGEDGRRDLTARLVGRYGTPEDRPAYWRQGSARAYLDRVGVPVQIHHGTADEVCPFSWSQATADELERLGKDVELFAYPGEDHRFDEGWPTLMRRTVDFFGTHLR